MSIAPVIFLIVLFIACYICYKTNKLTLAGTITGAFVALFIYLGTGFTGIGMLAAFFILATLATSHKKHLKKASDNISIEKRDARQVLANGGLAALAGLLAYLMPGNTFLATILVAASLSSATADTLSSELGTVYGSSFYNILSFKKDERGRDGVVSFEGILTGIAGSAVIATVYAFSFGWGNMFLSIIIAGLVGNITDSVLGATLERKGYINNNEVNLLNTITAGITCCILALTLH